MRFTIIASLVALSACSAETGPFDNPFGEINARVDDIATSRGATELYVKTHYDLLLGDIAAGGGAALDAAFDTAGVPQADRAARTLQLQGDLPVHRSGPGPLTAALTAYGG